jgi:hypothetical protein
MNWSRATAVGVLLAEALIALAVLPIPSIDLPVSRALAATSPAPHDLSRPAAWDCVCYQRGTPITFVTEFQPVRGATTRQTLEQLR